MAPIITRAIAIKDGVIAFVRRYPFIDFLFELADKTGRDYIGLIAAGMAFYFLLAAFPGIAALISLYGLIADPTAITGQFAYFERFLPADAYSILIGQAEKVASSHEGILSLGIIIGLLVAVFSASKGVRALIQGLNIAYGARERRNIFALGMTGYVLTFVMMFYFLISLSLVAGVPLVVRLLFLDGLLDGALMTLVTSARWPLLFFVGMLGLQILYYYGPCYKHPTWRWITWGSFVATILWLLSSVVFSYFVAHTASYSQVYGSLGAVIVLMLWFWLSALMIMFGAEINGVLEARRVRREAAAILKEPS